MLTQHCSSTGWSMALKNKATWLCKTNDLWCIKLALNYKRVHFFYSYYSLDFMPRCQSAFCCTFSLQKAMNLIFPLKHITGMFLFFYIRCSVQLACFFFLPFKLQNPKTFLLGFCILLYSFLSYTLLTASFRLLTLLCLHCLLQWSLSAFVVF